MTNEKYIVNKLNETKILIDNVLENYNGDLDNHINKLNYYELVVAVKFLNKIKTEIEKDVDFNIGLGKDVYEYEICNIINNSKNNE